MPNAFNVEILEFHKINKIENAWSAEDYKALLDVMGLDEGLESMSEEELKEMCQMSLSDFEPEESAKYVLSYLIKDELTDGKVNQISNDMMDDKLWEEFADLSFHERFFNAYSLLRESYNGIFTQPTGVIFQIKISSNNVDAFDIFETSLEASVVRLLASGLDENSVVNRLYDEKMASESFEEAKNILWDIKELSKSNSEVSYEITTSELWFGDLEDMESFKGSSHADVHAQKE